jgi:hypothetical protein
MHTNALAKQVAKRTKTEEIMSRPARWLEWPFRRDINMILNGNAMNRAYQVEWSFLQPEMPLRLTRIRQREIVKGIKDTKTSTWLSRLDRDK